MVFFNSHLEFYKKPLYPVSSGESIRFRFKSDTNGKVYLRTWHIDTENIYAMEKINNDIFECTIIVPDKPCQLWYCFKIVEENNEYYYGNNTELLGGIGQTYNSDYHSYVVIVYDKNFTTPEYLHKGNIYQIFPDRFFKGDYTPSEKIKGRSERQWHEMPLLQVDKNGDNYAHDFFMGNLRGIVEKLDYLYDLGIRTLYLNPIFKAATNHRYDTGDYNQIDPYLGDENEFKLLTSELKKRGMHLIIDGVFSHTGNDSLYFNQYGNYDSIGAFQSQESPYYGWYKFKDFPNDYMSWWGIYTLPEVNKESESYRDFIFNDKNGIAQKWINLGASAWRLDVADELPVDFIKNLRKAVKKANKDAILLGEVWEDASCKISYGNLRCYCYGDTLDSVMNYPIRKAVLDFFCKNISAYRLQQELLHQREVYPAPFLYALMNLISSHDRARPLNILCGREHANDSREYNKSIQLNKEQYTHAYYKYIQCIAILCAIPGSPTIYYGDEAGMQGTSDPWNRKPYPWGYEDKSLIREIKSLLNFRLEHSLLHYGKYDVIAHNDDKIEIVRYIDDEKDIFGNKSTNGKISLLIDRNTNEYKWITE